MSQHYKKAQDKAQDKVQTDRRRWLSLLAKSGALAGLVDSSPLAAAVLANRLAEAVPSKKFVLIFHPGGGARDYLTSVAVKPFVPFGGAVAALTMTVNKPGNHGLLQFCAGANSFIAGELNSSTIDQQIANTIGHLTPRRSIQLGALADYPDFIRNNGSSLPPINTPSGALEMIKKTLAAQSEPSAVVKNERRKAIVAAHEEGLTPLINRIGVDERFKLEEHIAALGRYQQQLELNSGLGSDGPCGQISYTQGTSPLNVYRAQGDLAVSALACGITNVASIAFSGNQESWIPNDGTVDAVPALGDMANILNSGQDRQYYTALNEYMNKGVAHVINKLMQAGIFQDTVVLCVTNMGDTSNNTPDGGPITVASGISGFKGGLQKLNKDHYEIFPDVVRLMGLEGAVGQTIYNYSGGGLVV